MGDIPKEFTRGYFVGDVTCVCGCGRTYHIRISHGRVCQYSDSARDLGSYSDPKCRYEWQSDADRQRDGRSSAYSQGDL